MSFFNFDTLDISFARNTKSCQVTIKNSEEFKRVKFISELESFFDWLATHIEIASVVIKPSSHKFNLIPGQEEMALLNEKTLREYLQKIQMTNYAQLILPQTMIWQLDESCDFLALELISGADIKVASHSFTTKLDYLKLGLTPCSGLIGVLASNSNLHRLKSWINTGERLSHSHLLEIGLLNDSTRDYSIGELLKIIASQSPSARMQFKRSINNTIIEKMDELILSESRFANAAIAIKDWQNYARNVEFKDPREIKQTLRSQAASA